MGEAEIKLIKETALFRGSPRRQVSQSGHKVYWKGPVLVGKKASLGGGCNQSRTFGRVLRAVKGLRGGERGKASASALASIRRI